MRLVRNAEPLSGTVTAQEGIPNASGGKVLIAFFSWGGNTRGIAREIQSQTGADLLRSRWWSPTPTTIIRFSWKPSETSTTRRGPRSRSTSTTWTS